MSVALTPPSGLSLTRYDVQWGDGVVHMRYVAGAGLTYDAVAGDFDWLCQTDAVDGLRAQGVDRTELVITISDREVPFGETVPEAVQFFELYDYDRGSCNWRGF